MQNTALRNAIEQQGNTALGGGAAEFERYIASETRKWKQVITQAQIRF